MSRTSGVRQPVSEDWRTALSSFMVIAFCCVLAASAVSPGTAATGTDKQPDSLQSGPSLSRYQYTQLHMGVPVRIVAYARTKAGAARACAAAFQEFARLDQIASDYRPTSELMRLCERAGGPPVRVSADLFLLLERSLDLSRRSDGAFDVTVGPYVALWRAARKSGRLPRPEGLREARGRVGWEKLRLDRRARTARLLVSRMRLDLGGIAKGYAGDRALAALRENGIPRALVEAGGDIVVGDPPPGRPAWEIELAGGGSGGVPRALGLVREAISTSGDTEQFVEIGGRRYSHIIDPRTGLGLTNRIMATVIARDGITSDGLATAVCVLGPERGAALVRSTPGARLYVRPRPGS
jgi:thiamine biosynthesis lipoprotein